MGKGRAFALLLLVLSVVLGNVGAFAFHQKVTVGRLPASIRETTQLADADPMTSLSRRDTLQHLSWMVSALATTWASFSPIAVAEDTTMYSPKFVQQYSDFIEQPGGWSYREVTTGKGEPAESGDRVVFDWSGYTIGYFGRPFQAKGGPQGGAFDKDLDYYRTVVGSGTMVKGLENAMIGMQPGGIRQVLVPFGPLSYPADDPSHDRVGPKPATFSGDRALNFVLENPRLDRTLLFNVKVIRVDKPNGRGGFNRG